MWVFMNAIESGDFKISMGILITGCLISNGGVIVVCSIGEVCSSVTMVLSKISEFLRAVLIISESVVRSGLYLCSVTFSVFSGGGEGSLGVWGY